MIELMVVVLMSQCGKFRYGEHGFSSILVLLELVAFQGIGEGIKNKMVLHRFREVKRHRGYTLGYTSITPLTERYLLSLSLSESSNRFHFSIKMDEDSELAKKMSARISPNFQKGRLRRPKNSVKSLLKAPKSTKNHS